WTHVAATSGKDGLNLFIDGVRISTNSVHYQNSSVGVEKRNYLGRSNFKVVFAEDADFHGQMDEVRVWKGARTEAQIRENFFKKLTGNEPDLVGLWNFDDPANPGRDSSPGAHHGKLVGQATVIKAGLPAIVYGKITDASGKLLANATVEIHQPGQPD